MKGSRPQRAESGAYVGQNGLIYFLSGTFFDPDPGDHLVYSATLDDGSALPAWMNFNASSPYLLILGANALLGEYSIRLSATDTFGAQASDTFTLDLISPDLIIYGTAGDDTLRGGPGNDFFVFNTALNAATNRDTILDFGTAVGNNDGIQLDNAVFTKLGAPGFLKPGRYTLTS